jgi:hypothetical protein
VILPVTQPTLAMDYSAASTLHACPRKFEYAYRQRLKPKGSEAPYLTAGTLMHDALHALYTVAWDLETGLEALRAAAEREAFHAPTAGKFAYLTVGHLELVLTHYFEERSARPTALESAVIADAGRGQAEEAITFDWAHEGHGRVIRVGGKLDLPTKLGGQRYVVDHKTTTSWLNDYWFRERFALGHQFRVYCAGMQALTGERYTGAYVNAIYLGEPPKQGWGKGKSVANALYGPMEFSAEQLDETWEWMETAQALAGFHAERGTWPQNEGACGAYGGCMYLDLCQRTPQVRKAIARMNYEVHEATGVLLSGADGSKKR